MRDAPPFAACDIVLHYVETLDEGNSWAIPSNFNIVKHNTSIIFIFPLIGFNTTMIIRAWQSPIVQPTFPSLIIDNPNLIEGPPTSNPIV